MEKKNIKKTPIKKTNSPKNTEDPRKKGSTLVKTIAKKKELTKKKFEKIPIGIKNLDKIIDVFLEYVVTTPDGVVYLAEELIKAEKRVNEKAESLSNTGKVDDK